MSIRLSALDEDILTLLGDRSLYGLAIVAEINIDRPIPLSKGSLYPALDRLVAKDLILGDWEEGRKYYQATQLGKDCLAEVQKYRKLLARR